MKTTKLFSVLAIFVMATVLSSCTTSKTLVNTNRDNIILTQGEVDRLGDALWTKQLFSSGQHDLVLAREYITTTDTVVDEEYANEVRHFDTLVVKLNTAGVAKFFSEGNLYVKFDSDTTFIFPFSPSGIDERYSILSDITGKISCTGNEWNLVSGKEMWLYFKPLPTISTTTIMNGAKVSASEETEE